MCTLPFEASFLADALPMVNKGWKLGDAIHYGTMVKHNIKEIVTDDRHFDDADGRNSWADVQETRQISEYMAPI